jgi:hypothetical protein
MNAPARMTTERLATERMTRAASKVQCLWLM